MALGSVRMSSRMTFRAQPDDISAMFLRISQIVVRMKAALFPALATGIRRDDSSFVDSHINSPTSIKFQFVSFKVAAVFFVNLCSILASGLALKFLLSFRVLLLPLSGLCAEIRTMPFITDNFFFWGEFSHPFNPKQQELSCK